MTYEEVLEFIHNALKGGIKPGLSRIARLMEHLGNPEKTLRFIHVAGTNGKGSTAATIASILKEAGYRTGLYISPFIQDFRERISIDGRMISKEDLVLLMERIIRVSHLMEREELGAPTEFELVTALAFLYYAEQHCDFVVLEVGLGGRFDATNVIDVPLVSVICSISMDHMEYLGDTLEQIAFEKAGIMKEGGVTVLYPVQQPCVFETIRELAGERKNELITPALGELRILRETSGGNVFQYRGEEYRTPLLGEHQIYNALTALEAVRVLQRTFAIPEDAVKNGMAHTAFPGRLEMVHQHPDVLIDGGHNSDGVRCTVEAVKKLYPGRRILGVIGVCKDKEYQETVSAVAQLCDVLIATQADTPRRLDAAQVAKVAQAHCNHVLVAEKPEEAIRLALREAAPQDVILCCGSLYWIGDIRTYFHKNAFER